MKKDIDKEPKVAPLRRRAENRLLEKQAGTFPPSDRTDLKKLIHELQVHQIELEMQNDELNRTRGELEEVLAKYTDLYDFAPVGYLTFDDKGFITEMNLTAAQLLGMERSFLVNKPFFSFIQREFQDHFYRYLQRVLGSPEKQIYELILQKKNGTPFNAQLESISTEFKGQRLVRTVFTDITYRTEIQEALAISEVRYRRLFEMAQEGILLLNADTGQIIDVNPFLVDMLGYTREEFLGKKFWEMSAFRNTNANKTAFRRLQREGYSRYDDLFLIASDGREIDVEIVGNIYEVKQVRVIQCNIRNITAQKRAKKILLASETRYVSFIEVTGQLAWSTNSEGKVVEDLLMWRKYTGQREQEVKGTGWANALHPDDVEHALKTWNHALATRNAYEVGYRIRRYDGLYRDFLVHGLPVYNQDESVREWVGTCIDITERKQIESELEKHRDHLEHLVEERTAKLRQSETKYRGLVDNALVGVYQIDINGDILYCNDALLGMLGFEESEDIVSTGFAAILRNAKDRRILRNMLNESGRVDHYEVQLFTKKGQPVYTIVSAILENDLVSGMVLDISARKRSEEERIKLEVQLRRTQKMEAIGTLAGGIAHDFNNILSGVLGFTEMAMEDTSPDNPLYRHLEHVMKGARRGRDLVKQILTFSCFDELEKQPLVLSSIVDEALGLLRPALPATISIRKHLVAGHSMVFADPVQMHQVIMNLCTNAAHAMKGKTGVLELSIVDIDSLYEELRLDAGLQPCSYIRLSVTDTGCGMTPEVLEEIFDPFFTTKGPGEGTGLGLSVVHGIVKGHGGHLTVSSIPGEGSTFNVYLPTVESFLSAEAGTQTAIPRGEERILFVDDEVMLTELNFQRLSGLGYEVVTSTSSLDALKFFQAEPDKFDLVITDYTMPAMTGIDLARAVLAIKPDIPVVLLSGLNEKILPEKIEEAGIRAFLSKTSGKRELASLIRQVLEKNTKS